MIPHFTIEGEIGAGGVTPADLAAFLTGNPGNVTLQINSLGGSATDGAAMMASVEAHGSVTVHVRGVAASAATLIMVAAAEVVIHAVAMVMIHEPYAFADGTADAHRSAADALDKMTNTYAAAYARHTGHPVARIAEWMKAETWMTAAEAVELRFADRVEDGGAALACAAFDYRKFRHAPDQLVQMATEKGWVTNSPAVKEKEKTVAA
ncbi:head maturation protease, ClpP-related [Paracoccus sp. IB05]|uniref:head maturation protease, ClpP-related n=1 Tax=Paracoccus sp. IB05 TaxID=2779367 RepID=UPI0018E85242|nr:head maturation protease, ClpP-related [Paracoccus sp. IB05]MBJ2151363.1 Clp protease ClpP [Paracoccus sp. IB05]